jgi:hypothetical protein
LLDGLNELGCFADEERAAIRRTLNQFPACVVHISCRTNDFDVQSERSAHKGALPNAQLSMVAPIARRLTVAVVASPVVEVDAQETGAPPLGAEEFVYADPVRQAEVDAQLFAALRPACCGKRSTTPRTPSFWPVTRPTPWRARWKARFWQRPTRRRMGVARGLSAPRAAPAPVQ